MFNSLSSSTESDWLSSWLAGSNRKASRWRVRFTQHAEGKHRHFCLPPISLSVFDPVSLFFLRSSAIKHSTRTKTLSHKLCTNILYCSGYFFLHKNIFWAKKTYDSGNWGTACTCDMNEIYHGLNGYIHVHYNNAAFNSMRRLCDV